MILQSYNPIFPHFVDGMFWVTFKKWLVDFLTDGIKAWDLLTTRVLFALQLPCDCPHLEMTPYCPHHSFASEHKAY